MYLTKTQLGDQRACSLHALSEDSHWLILIPQQKQIVVSPLPENVKILGISENKKISKIDNKTKNLIVFT